MSASEQPPKEKVRQELVIRGALVPPTEAARSRAWTVAAPKETSAAGEMRVVKACHARAVAEVAAAVAAGEGGSYDYGPIIIK